MTISIGRSIQIKISMEIIIAITNVMPFETFWSHLLQIFVKLQSESYQKGVRS